MPIQRCSDQKRLTLEGFYRDMIVIGSESYREVAKNMLKLVALINETFKETTLWDLTSHARLVIQAADDWKAPWYVVISNIGTEQYFFEYLLPQEQAPWPDATVRGEAKDLEEDIRYLLIAMNRCKGWPENPALSALMKLNAIQ